jgi:hypothetical protein
MKHLLQKTIFQGGIKKKKAKPAPPPTLKPAKLGAYKVLSSYSVADIIDLISDGPIEGLVNQYGQKLTNEAGLLQGVYLNNTPIATSTLNPTIDFKERMFSAKISDRLRMFGDIFYNQSTQKFYKYAPLQKDLAQSSGLFGALITAVNSLKTLISYPVSSVLLHQTFGRFSQVTGLLGSWSKLTNARFDAASNSGIGSGNPFVWARVSTGGLWFYHRANHIIEVHLVNDALSSPYSLVAKAINDFDKDINNTSINEVQKSFAIKAKQMCKNIKASGFSIYKNNTSYVAIQLGSKENPFKLNTASNNNKSIFKTGTSEIEEVNFVLEGMGPFYKTEESFKALVPIVNSQNEYTGEIYGIIIFKLNLRNDVSYVSAKSKVWIIWNIVTGGYKTWKILNIEPFIRNNIGIILKRGRVVEEGQSLLKYNFTNIAVEFRDGEEYQRPLKYFNNIYVDFDLNQELIGPFRANNSVQRISTNWDSNGPAKPSLNRYDFNDGSVDNRAQGNFSNWGSPSNFDEVTTPITHTVENPNVESVAFTLLLSQLQDAATQSASNREAGDKLPSIVNVEVEWGKVHKGEYTKAGTKRYSILAIVDGSTYIDFGYPDKTLEAGASTYYNMVRDVTDGFGANKQASPFTPFLLPKLLEGESESDTKRYIRISKLSSETNSSLIYKEIGVAKFTEIIPNNLSYPYSAIAGVKIDARSIGEIVERSYDCRLKKIQVPNNYFPLEDSDSRDKRYITSASEYIVPKQIYIGDWDGTFREAWTDNPAWILYDLLTSKRYGLGGYIEESQINIWELYKIGRFCDAVDDEGYFEGVSDGVGGLEPRFSCNIIFKEQTKIYDAITSIANLFRGAVYFSNSEIHFLDDRPRIPIAIFNNSNVKDGLFSYANTRRDQQYNTVEVNFLDRFDNYQVKVEYVQDEQDIRKRGIFKTTISTMGVTSRAMARRMGRLLIYSTIKENQAVEFIAGLEALLCKPGDLIIVEDEMKTRSTNYGRILSIDYTNNAVTVENSYDNVNFNGRLTVYTPTGYTTIQESNDRALSIRSRVPYFDVTGLIIDANDSILTGRYYFSYYTPGAPNLELEELDEEPSQFAVYTGLHVSGHKLFAYPNTGVSGYVFSTGLAFEDNNTYDKVITSTGLVNINQTKSTTGVNNVFTELNTGFRYSAADGNKRGATSGSLFNALEIDFEPYRGILPDEISTVNYPQITTFNITGYDNLDYGAKLFIDENDINVNLIPFIAIGGIYRLQRTNASDQIYKITSIKENKQNEYAIVGKKYDTGKFVEIENFQAQDFLPSTYYSGPLFVGNVEVSQLAAPTINQFTTGYADASGFSLTGSWSRVENAQGYYFEVYNELIQSVFASGTDSNNVTGFEISGIENLGNWKLKVQSSGNGTSFLNSAYAKTGVFVAYQNLETAPLSRPFVSNFTII